LGAIVAIYTGGDVGAARLVTASGDPDVVRRCAEAFAEIEVESDPVLGPIAAGRRAALRLLVGDESDE